MSNGTDSSSSSEDYKKHKKSKRQKHKSEKKKHKKKEKKVKHHKDKKRDRQEKILKQPMNVQPSKHREICKNDDTFGPALPPHLRKVENKTEQVLIGPALPSDLLNATHIIETEKESEIHQIEEPLGNNEINDDFSYGPMPVPMDAEGITQMSATQIELEQRALELKLAVIEGGTCKTSDAKVREEWMLELPAVGLKGGLAALSNMKRTFHQGKERPDFSDRSSWTKTPQDVDKPTASTSKSTTNAESLKRNAELAYERQRDEEQARLAKKHKKDHKRDESLVEMHQKKLRKEQRKKEKELAAAGAKPERRPFSRDVDLKLNKIDKNQTKQIVDKAKILNSKFASGKTKYL
ncbi:GPALPP motifs-containing protein 1 [Ceratitis capitata]|uniref:(Mediterranean fruit fly) hypothetical protein n=1 Tax=Ceratitis capitata TaxID=7213 RepID=W8BMQ5_CERCA|nr:GPALPP motifs-containing protein 1 [Ceratitis capitata]CAD6993059.1 unnamed protein product [Ceratitis capitata]